MSEYARTEDIDEALKSAEEAARLGKLHEADKRFRALLGGRHAAAAYKGLGDLFAKQRQDKKAIQVYRRAVELNPAFAEAQNNLANVLWRDSRDATAVDHYSRAIEIDPKLVDAYKNLALVTAEMGDVDSAVGLLERASDEFPNSGAIWQQLSVLYVATGRIDESLSAIDRALKLDEGNPDFLATASAAYRSAGDLERSIDFAKRAIIVGPMSLGGHVEAAETCAQQGKVAEAVSYARQAVAVCANDARSHDALGRALMRAKAYRDAADSFDRALKLDPRLVRTWLHRAALFEQIGQLSQAEKAYRSALSVRANSSAASIGLADVLRKQGKLDEAVEILEKIVEKDPKNSDAWTNLSTTLRNRGRYEEALDAALQGAQHGPQNAVAHFNLGTGYQVLGRFAEARESFRQALEIDPGLVEALYALVHSSESADARLLEDVARRLSDEKLDQQHRSQLHFALARLHDQRGDCAAAFKAASEGHKFAGRGMYDAAFHDRLVANSIQVFTTDFFDQRRDFGSRSTKPIFIVGLPRTGTTLVEQVLSSHSQVFGAGELGKISQLIGEIGSIAKTDAPFPANVLLLHEPGALSLATKYLRNLRGLGANSPKVTDKMPGNIFYLGFIHLIFPQAKVIYCRRNPLDTFISGFLLRFSEPVKHVASQESFYHYFKCSERISNHWKDVLPDAILEVTYEDFVADQEKWTRAILDHVELPWDDACLDYFRTKRAVRTGSAAQVRKPLYTTSIGRHRGYDAHLKELNGLVSRSLET